nr:ATPase domain-containing protein [Methanobacterium formicicum]
MSMIETGIPGLDELLSLNDGEGFPQNTTTLVYGPPKVGKSIFFLSICLPWIGPQGALSVHHH